MNIDITPRTHHNDDVSLTLKLAVQSISGVGYNNLPTFGNREINTVIRLRDGETNMLAGLIRDDERRTLDGIPGLSDLPVVGRLFAHNRTETTQTDIILTLTPHIVRVLDLSETDLRAFRVGRESVTPIVELPVLQNLPPPESAAPGSAAAAAAPDGSPSNRPHRSPRHARIRRRRRRACRGSGREIPGTRISPRRSAFCVLRSTFAFSFAFTSPSRR